jgi:hypothetical protein
VCYLTLGGGWRKKKSERIWVVRQTEGKLEMSKIKLVSILPDLWHYTWELGIQEARMQAWNFL